MVNQQASNPGYQQREGEPPPGAKKKVIRAWTDDGKMDNAFTPPIGFYATDAFTDKALEWLDEPQLKTQPFFLYLPYTAPHYPLHAWPEDIAKYEGRYDAGYEAIRNQRHQRMQELGIIDSDTPLPAWKGADWSSMKGQDKALMRRRMEVYLEALSRDGKVLGTLGKGWPAYRTAAGVSATGHQPWRELTATLHREDVPKGTTQARAVCSVQVAVPGDGYAFFDDLACRPVPVTSDFQLLQDEVVQAGNLGSPTEPLSFRFDIYAPELASQSIDAKLEVKGYWGVTVRERAVRITIDDSGRASIETKLKQFPRTGWYSVRLQDDAGRTLCESAFGMVDPSLASSDVDPASPYGVAEVNERDLEVARRVGIKAVRHSVTFNVQWGWIEPKRGQFNSYVLNEAITKADRLEPFGIQSGVMIGGWSPKNIPQWAQQPTDRSYNDTHQRKIRPKGNYSLPSDLKAWQAYLSHVSTAFRGKLGVWEIWNENDIPEFWQGSVEDYLTLLRSSSQAIRAADPQAKIAMCGISTTIVGQDHHEWFKKRRDEVQRELDIDFDPRGFLNRVLRDGKDDFDILNFHPYGTLDQIEKGCRLVRDAAIKHGCEDRPLWITETGVGTHLTGPYRATPQEQARRYWQIHAICRAYGADKLFWLSFVDLGRDPHYHWDNFGLLDLDRVPKPALLAQAALARHLGNASFVKQIPLGDNIRAFEFDRDGVPVTMIWSDRYQTLQRPLTGASTVRDIMGNQRATFAAAILTELQIGPDPILLIGGRIKNE